MLTRIAAAFIFLIVAATTAAFAQQDPAEQIAVENEWLVYVADTNSGRVCFAVSQPISTEPTGVNRDAIYFMLSTWPIRGAINEASIIIGYPFQPGLTVTVTIDNGETFEFFTIGDAAWLSDLDRENDLVVAMRRGLTMIVRGLSQRGTNTIDTYSLRGVTAAINRAGQECQ